MIRLFYLGFVNGVWYNKLNKVSERDTKTHKN